MTSLLQTEHFLIVRKEWPAGSRPAAGPADYCSEKSSSLTTRKPTSDSLVLRSAVARAPARIDQLSDLAEPPRSSRDSQLPKSCGIPFAGLDVYLNVAGGLKVSEPAADLAVAAALLSAREDAALPEGAIVFGEISLSGALRNVSQTENRLKEAQKLGFSSAIAAGGGKPVGVSGISLRTMPDLTSFVGEIFGAG